MTSTSSLLGLSPFVYHGERRRVERGSRYGRQSLGRLCYAFIHQVDGTSLIGPKMDGRQLRPGQSILLDPGTGIRWSTAGHLIRAPFDLLARSRRYTDIARLHPGDDQQQPPLRSLFGNEADGLIPAGLQRQAARFATAVAMMRPKRPQDVWTINGQLAHLLAGYLDHLQGQATPPVSDPARLAFAPMVEQHLMAGATQGITVQAVAEAIGMTAAALSQRYRLERGRGAKDFLTRHRIDLAKALLRDGGQTIADIARAVGFAGPVPFRSNFRRLTGLSPSQWRLASRLGQGSG